MHLSRIEEQEVATPRLDDQIGVPQFGDIEAVVILAHLVEYYRRNLLFPHQQLAARRRNLDVHVGTELSMQVVGIDLAGGVL